MSNTNGSRSRKGEQRSVSIHHICRMPYQTNNKTCCINDNAPLPPAYPFERGGAQMRTCLIAVPDGGQVVMGRTGGMI